MSTNIGPKNTTSGGGLTSPGLTRSDVQQLFEEFIPNKMTPAKVTDIILTRNHPEFPNQGKWGSIGTIFFSIPGKSGDGESFARPYLSNLNSYPLVNEFVLLFQLPSYDSSTENNEGKTNYYYLPAINLFNNPHLNPIPTPTFSSNFETGTSNSSDTPNYEFNSPKDRVSATFIEADDLSTPLQPFAGDNIFQGRFGNSIRLGSTSRYSKNRSLNDWSEVGLNGSPITIIQNGQNEKGYKNVSEDINKNDSSIYLTSTQRIPLETKYLKVPIGSYSVLGKNLEPGSINTYSSTPQLLLSSGRIVLDSKGDHTIISSQESIHLKSNKSVNIDTTNVVVNAEEKIRLGANASEPLIKGEVLFKVLDNVLKVLVDLTNSQQNQVMWPKGKATANLPASAAYKSAFDSLDKIKNSLADIKSKKSFTS